jgi:hypothetical protein
MATHKHTKRKSVEISPEDADSEAGKLAVRNEGIHIIIKLCFALVFVFIGACLTYSGTTTSEYSLKIQLSESSYIEFTNTPMGVVVLVLSILLVWRTRQNIKIGKK